MDTHGASDLKRRRPEPPRQESDASPHDGEVLPWEHLGDDLWLPRRVRGSFHGGALG